MESPERKSEEIHIPDEVISNFAALLEAAGYEDAEGLIREDLIPIAREKHISLYDACREYANPDEEQDTSWYQLFLALNRVPPAAIQELDIHKSL